MIEGVKNKGREFMSLVRERDQTPSNYFSEKETKHLIYSGLIILTYIHYLNTPCQGFSPTSLKSSESKNTFT